ncbi:carbonic anhydrase [Lipomyces arxii]|uniref:carbonic anhydrase n=1 Tax=Lipomyces arxii TaxID=56418 RepID=UPI0034CD3A8F
MKGDMLNKLLDQNKQWADKMDKAHPDLFERNGKGQQPEVLWIGCSDSRAGEGCVDCLPGTVFVHRNIANMLPYGDLSSLSVVQFAVEVLRVEQIIICGHYDCGGVVATMGNKRLGLMDNWLKHLRDVRARHKDELYSLETLKERCNRLVELNIIAQVHNVKRMAPVVDALAEGRIEVAGVLYDVGTGLLRTLEIPADSNEEDYLVVESNESVE